MLADTAAGKAIAMAGCIACSTASIGVRAANSCAHVVKASKSTDRRGGAEHPAISFRVGRYPCRAARIYLQQMELAVLASGDVERLQRNTGEHFEGASCDGVSRPGRPSSCKHLLRLSHRVFAQAGVRLSFFAWSRAMRNARLDHCRSLPNPFVGAFVRAAIWRDRRRSGHHRGDLPCGYCFSMPAFSIISPHCLNSWVIISPSFCAEFGNGSVATLSRNDRVSSLRVI
jgi:hypothetical protein